MQDKPLRLRILAPFSQHAGQRYQLLLKGHVGQHTSATANHICSCLCEPQATKDHEEADGDCRGTIAPAPAHNQDATVLSSSCPHGAQATVQNITTYIAAVVVRRREQYHV